MNALAKPVMRLVATASPLADNARLVRGVVAKEPWATQQVWESYAPMVFGLLERSLGPAGEAEDVMQEVFLRVYSRAHTINDPNALRSFVYSVAIRILKWELRKRRVRHFLRLSPSGDLPDAPAPTADLEHRDLLRRFYAVLDRLESQERLLFGLRHLERLTVQEMTEVLGISAATVKRRLAVASTRVANLVAADPALKAYFRQSRGALAE